MRVRRARIGDIAEIKTPKGLAYVQYSHDGGDMGELVRVLPGLYSVRPDDLGKLAQEKELYFIFYTLNYALRDGDAEIICNQPLPEWAKSYPMMRRPGGWDHVGRTLNWLIADASKPMTIEGLRQMLNVRELAPEQERLSIYKLRPHRAMVKELARGWTPGRAEELRLQDLAEAKGRNASQPDARESSGKPLQHYFYFAKRSDADKAADRLRARGFSVGVRMGADRVSWLTLAAQEAPNTGESIEELRNEFEDLAEELDGEYDGWEISVENSAPN